MSSRVGGTYRKTAADLVEMHAWFEPAVATRLIARRTSGRCDRPHTGGEISNAGLPGVGG